MSLRCFIAVDIPETIKNGIGELVETLKKYDADVKWVTAANLHLTLKFLGDTPETAIPQIQKALSTVVSSYMPFCMKIRGTGCSSLIVNIQGYAGSGPKAPEY